MNYDEACPLCGGSGMSVIVSADGEPEIIPCGACRPSDFRDFIEEELEHAEQETAQQ